MMGASTYEGVYVATQAAENAGTRDKIAVTSALASLEMPQIIEVMENETIRFTDDYREARFVLYMEQLPLERDCPKSPADNCLARPSEGRGLRPPGLV